MSTKMRADQLDTGTSANQVVKLDGSSKLPAVDGSQLTGIAVGLTINTQTGVDTYTLVLADDGKMITMDNASANAITIPTEALVAFPIGTQILVEQEGVGTTAIDVIAGSPPAVTLHSAGGLLETSTQYSILTLIKKATDTWVVAGDLA